MCIVFYTSCIPVYYLYNWCPNAQVRALEPFKLKLQKWLTTGDAGNFTQVLWKRSQYYEPLSHLYSSSNLLLKPEILNDLILIETVLNPNFHWQLLKMLWKSSTLWVERAPACHYISHSNPWFYHPQPTENNVSLWSVRIKWNKTWKWSATQPLSKGSKKIG